MTNTLIVALAFGLAFGVSISMTLHHSGGHINPAVTLGMLASGMISLAQAVGHMVSQMLGAIVAALLLHALVPRAALKGSHMGANVLPHHSHSIHAFFGAPRARCKRAMPSGCALAALCQSFSRTALLPVRWR